MTREYPNRRSCLERKMRCERLDPALAETDARRFRGARLPPALRRATTRSWSLWTRVAGATGACTSALHVRALNEMSGYFPAWRE